MTTTWKLPRETVEWVGPITVTVDDVPVTEFEVSLYRPPGRPVVWQTPTAGDGGMGVLVGPGTDNVLPVGQTRGAVRYVDSPETPVLTDVFFIRIT